MSDQFVAEIRLFPCNFAPKGWAFCNGQLMLISQNTALFSLLGTTYGGDGRSNFALPNLQGRVPIGFGQGPGLTLRSLGELGGADTVALDAGSMPQHTHAIGVALTANARNAPGNQQSPVGNVPAIEAAGVTATYSNAGPNADMRANAITFGGTATAQPAGGAGQSGAANPHENRQPYLALNYCIALQGVFPPRS
jgi:microcystin-dependent protein